MKEKIIQILKNRIGKKNSISARDIYIAIYKINPEKCDKYEKLCNWKKITRIISSIRRTDKVFTFHYINETGAYYYILSNKKELEEYENYCKNRIKSLSQMIILARKSINEKWYKKI